MCLRALCASDVGFAEGISQREGERLRRVSTPITYNLLPLTSNLSPHRLIAHIPSRLQVHRTVHHPAAPLILFLSVQLSEDKSSQGCILGLFFKEFTYKVRFLESGKKYKHIYESQLSTEKQRSQYSDEEVGEPFPSNDEEEK